MHSGPVSCDDGECVARAVCSNVTNVMIHAARFFALRVGQLSAH